LERVRSFEVQSQLALADSKNVAMRISEPWRNGFTRQIDDVCFVGPEFFGVRILSNENDATALDRNCLGGRLLAVNGVDISVNENCLGSFRAGRNATHK